MVTCYMAVRFEPEVAAGPFLEVQNDVHGSENERNRNGFVKNQNLEIFLLNHCKDMHLTLDSDNS